MAFPLVGGRHHDVALSRRHVLVPHEVAQGHDRDAPASALGAERMPQAVERHRPPRLGPGHAHTGALVQAPDGLEHRPVDQERSIVRAEHPQPPLGQRRQRCDDPRRQRHPAHLVVLRRPTLPSTSIARRIVSSPPATSVHWAPRSSPTRSPASTASSTTTLNRSSAAATNFPTSSADTATIGASSALLPPTWHRSVGLPITLFSYAYLSIVDSTASRLLTVLRAQRLSSIRANASTSLWRISSSRMSRRTGSGACGRSASCA